MAGIKSLIEVIPASAYTGNVLSGAQPNHISIHVRSIGKINLAAAGRHCSCPNAICLGQSMDYINTPDPLSNTATQSSHSYMPSLETCT